MGSVPQSPRTAFRVLSDDVDRRVDRVVRRLLPRLPLSRLYQALREGDIRVNGARVTPATRTRVDDLIRVDPILAASGRSATGHRQPGQHAPPGTAPARPPPPRAAPAPPARPPPRGRPPPRPAPPVPVLYRDSHILIVDKPAGLAVHGEHDSVMTRLAARTLPRTQALSFAPAPVHQLDRVTSGALVVALTLAAARSWSAALRSGQVVKLYLAVAAGDLRTPAEGALWEDRLRYDRRTRRAWPDPAGAYARARVWAVARATGAAGARLAATLLLVRLHTGRRHQIRAQAAARRHALLGDIRYADGPHRGRAHRAAHHGPASGSTASGPGAGWPVLHAAAIGNDAAAHCAAVAAPLPSGACRAIERQFGPAAVRRARSAVARQLAGGSRDANAGHSGEFEHG